MPSALRQMDSGGLAVTVGGDERSGAVGGDHARHGFEGVVCGFHDVMTAGAVDVHVEEAGSKRFCRRRRSLAHPQAG